MEENIKYAKFYEICRYIMETIYIIGDMKMYLQLIFFIVNKLNLLHKEKEYAYSTKILLYEILNKNCNVNKNMAILFRQNMYIFIYINIYIQKLCILL